MKLTPTDPAAIASALHLFFGADEAFEVRILGADGNERWKKSVFLRGRDIDRMADRLAHEADTATAGIHFTPHGLDPAVLRRGNCVIAPVLKDKSGNAKPRLAHDEDAPGRRFLLIDVDPIRIGMNKGDSATEAEKTAALSVAYEVEEYFELRGWEEPLIVDSGNGYHCYYRLPAPLAGGPVDSAADPLAKLLRLLAAKFDTDAAHIDTNVFNAGRTMKVPGTPSRKGPGTADRPHRQSQILSTPNDWLPESAYEDVEVEDMAGEQADGLTGQPNDPANINRIREVRATLEASNAHVNQTGELLLPMSIEQLIAEDDPTGELSRPKGGGVQPLSSSSYTRPPETDVIERAKRYVAKMPPAIQGQGGSGAAYAVATVLVHGFDLSPDVALSLLTSEYNPRCEPPWSDAELRHKIDDAAGKGHHQPKGWLLQDDGGLNATTSPRPSPSAVSQDQEFRAPGEVDDPHRLAGSFLARKEYAHLRSYRDGFVEWVSGAYRDVKNGDVKAILTNWIHGEFLRAHALAVKKFVDDKEEGKEPPKLRQVTVSLVNNVINAIRGGRLIRSSVDAPCWIDGVTGKPDPRNIVALRNGLYDIANGTMLDHSPSYLTFSVAPFDYDPHAATPARWLKFLAEVWPDDPASIACLQEWFGYLLTPDTSRQKILFLLGPPGAGKGTIGRVLNALVGDSNFAGPQLDDLAGDYALFPLATKSVAFVADASLDRKNKTKALGVLKNVSGEDKMTVQGKYRDPVQMKLPTRFVIAANELPSFADSSSALHSRAVMIQFTRKFRGQVNEEQGLSETIAASELSGIFLWAIEGLKRLQANKKFTQPESAHQSLQEFKDSSSPVGQFLDERCVIESGATIITTELFNEFKRWCEESGRRDDSDSADFGKAVKSAESRIKRGKQYRHGGKFYRDYEGVRLKLDSEYPPSVTGVSGVSGDSLLLSQLRIEDVLDGVKDTSREYNSLSPDTPDAPVTTTNIPRSGIGFDL